MDGFCSPFPVSRTTPCRKPDWVRYGRHIMQDRNQSVPKSPECALSRSLESTMQNVLDGLMEAACQLLHEQRCSLADLTILSIEPAEGRTMSSRATVHHLPLRRSSDVLSYLLRREQQRVSTTQ